MRQGIQDHSAAVYMLSRLPLDQTIISILNDTIWHFLPTCRRTPQPDVRPRPRTPAAWSHSDSLWGT